MRKDLFFINTKVFLPVIHVTDNKTNVFNNIEICIEAKADGIFLISHGYLNYKELIHLGKEIKNKYPSLWIGYNFLDIKNTEVFPKIAEYDCEIEGIWIDDSKQGILGAESEAETISKSYLDGETNAKINDFKPFLYFGGVAFKYCKQPNDLSKSTVEAFSNMDIVTTSGDGTGLSANIKKIKTMYDSLCVFKTNNKHNKECSLALASGVSIDNIHTYLPYVDYFLVSSSISDNHDILNKEKTIKLSELIHSDFM